MTRTTFLACYAALLALWACFGCASGPNDRLQLGTCYPVENKVFHVGDRAYGALECPGGILLLVPDESLRKRVQA